MVNMKLSQREKFERVKFYHVDVGSGKHGKVSCRLWLSMKLVQRDEKGLFVEFPLNAQIVKTEKGNYVVKPGPGIIYDVYGGYRGGAEFSFHPSKVRLKL